MTDLKLSIKSILPTELKKSASNFYYGWINFANTPRCLLNKYFLQNYLIRKNPGLHIGCGDIRLKRCVNLDLKATSATDITHDCSDLSIFPERSFNIIFSNAFFEHIFMEKRVPCLKSAYRVLKDNGALLFVGIPNFKEVAKAYLSEKPGILSEKFDLYHVYRYTHGAPELAWRWFGQLHKSLFDKPTVEKMLLEAGFKNFLLFNYSHREENLAINIGILAFKKTPKIKISTDWLKKFTKKYTGDVNPKGLKIILKRFS